jgi:outer membrane protein OmpA-like peptidoglycan-associated protein
MFRAVALAIAVLVSVQASAQDEIRKSIYFDGGSWYIDRYQQQELMRWIDSVPNLLDKYQIQLISHTDPIGGKQYNEWLSKMRSGAVFDLLVLQNIPQEKISIRDWGLENPVYSNDSWEGRFMNRRVDVILHPIVF